MSLIGFGLATYIACQPIRPLSAIIKGREIRCEEIKKEVNIITTSFTEDEPKWINIIATFYTKDAKECGKQISDGITASGRKASESRGTIAVNGIPFFSELYISDLHKNFIVEDRGNREFIHWINDSTVRIDIYVESKNYAKKMGVKKYKGYFIKIIHIK